jgi:ABC-type transport system involved in multi-copper enzyme maturation permease subunit
MSFLPIVNRELRVASRRRATYWLRCFLALAVGGIWFLLLLIGEHSMAAAQRGKVLFMTVGVMTFAFCFFAGVFLTADCVSEEKREGTLGLLFLTELTGYDVVLGKLIATSLHAFYGVISVLPLLALSLLLGGVSVGEFWRTTLVLILTLLLSLSLGMLVSVVSRETRQAMAVTFLVLLVLAGLLPLLSSLQSFLLRRATWEVLSWPSPVYLYAHAFDTWFSTGIGQRQFWGSLLTVSLLSAGALLAASLRLPHAWRDKAEPLGKRRFNPRWAWRARSTNDQPALRSLLEKNPFEWLTLRDNHPRRFAWGVLCVLLPIWLGFVAGCFSQSMVLKNMSFATSWLMAYGIHQVLKYLIGIEASRRLNDDLRSGALELLLVTPLSTKQIVTGQRRALRALYLKPMLLVWFTNLVLLWLILGPDPLGMGPFQAPFFCELVIGGAIMLWVDFHALSWIGMWMGLQKGKHYLAILATLGRVMLVPWLAILFLVFLSVGGRAISDPAIRVLAVLWFILAATIELAFLVRAKLGLKEMKRENFSATHVAPPAIPPLIQGPIELAAKP